MDVFPIILSVVAAFVATLLAGVFVIRYRRSIGLFCAFTAGVLIALAFFDMLPEVFALIPKTLGSLSGTIIMVISVSFGFIFLYFIDRLFSQPHTSSVKPSSNNFAPIGGALATAEFCTHGFIEGVAIGIGFQFNFQLGAVVAFAVVSHDFCDGVSTVTLMLNSGNTVKASIIMLFADAIAPVLGGIVTLFFDIPIYYMVFLLSFIAGGFIYVGFGSLLPAARKQSAPLVIFAFFAAGFVMIFIIGNMISA